MLRWTDVAAENAGLMEAGHGLLFQHGIGLAYLATADAGNAPRLHPIVVVQAEGSLYTFLIPSPKQRDLERNPRYALHAYSSAESDDEFALRGEVRLIADNDTRRAVIDAAQHDVATNHGCYEFLIESALHAKYEYRGHWPPAYTIWRAAS